MYPHERSLVKKLANQPFALIGVNSDSDLEALQQTLKDENITWRSFWNGPEGTRGPISTRWNVRGWPTIYVLDAEGKIRYKNVRGAQLDEAISTLLAEIGVDVDLSDAHKGDDPAREPAARGDEAKGDEAKGDEARGDEAKGEKEDKGL